MTVKILISDPSNEYAQRIRQEMDTKYYEVELAQNGREAQLKCYKSKYHALILDVDTQNHSGMEVLKYFKVHAPLIKIILTVASQKRLDDLRFSKNDFFKMGVSDLLIKPYTTERLLKSITGELQFELYKNFSYTRDKDSTKVGEEMSARDDLFTKIKIDEFLTGSACIFDLYVQINPNRYVKILHRGDFLSREQIERFKGNKKIEYLYFYTKDRALYVYYLNGLIEKLNQKPNKNVEVKIKAMKQVTEKYIEEIYTVGLKPELVAEGEKVCKNIHLMVKNEKEMYKHLRQLEDRDYSAYSHAFLVVFLSSMMCHFLEWGGEKTIQTVSWGAMFHDIGKLKLDPVLSSLNPLDMTDKQRKKYEDHPLLGVEMIARNRFATTEVRQIILQHHETMDGEGFPKGLIGIKIYPLAQVVGFVNYCAIRMAKEQSTPVAMLKNFFNEGKDFIKFNPKVIKAFVQCFVKEELKP